MSKDNNAIQQIIESLANAATAAASTVGSAAQKAGKAVGEKYDVVKMKLELNRLQSEQRNVFADIGRTMFLLQNGGFSAENGQSPTDAQQLIDQLLLLADEKQQNIDALSEAMSRLSGNVVCVVCGRVCNVEDSYCPNCGAKLPSEE